MNAEFVNVLTVLVYFLFGTVGIVLLIGWALKHFGTAKREAGHKPKGVPSGNTSDGTRKANRGQP